MRTTRTDSGFYIVASAVPSATHGDCTIRKNQEGRRILSVYEDNTAMIPNCVQARYATDGPEGLTTAQLPYSTQSTTEFPKFLCQHTGPLHFY